MQQGRDWHEPRSSGVASHHPRQQEMGGGFHPESQKRARRTPWRWTLRGVLGLL